MEKVNFHSNTKKSSTKECSNYCTIALISHASNILLSVKCSMWNEKFQMYKLDLEKAEEPEIKLPTYVGLWKKQGDSKNTSTSASLTMLKPLTVWITINCGKFWKRWEYQTTFSASWETCIQVKKQRLELDMEQWTGSKLEKEYVKAVYGHPCLFNFCAEKFI